MSAEAVRPQMATSARNVAARLERGVIGDDQYSMHHRPVVGDEP
jgi:hypothetical protein